MNIEHREDSQEEQEEEVQRSSSHRGDTPASVSDHSRRASISGDNTRTEKAHERSESTLRTVHSASQHVPVYIIVPLERNDAAPRLLEAMLAEHNLGGNVPNSGGKLPVALTDNMTASEALAARHDGMRSATATEALSALETRENGNSDRSGHHRHRHRRSQAASVADVTDASETVVNRSEVSVNSQRRHRKRREVGNTAQTASVAGEHETEQPDAHDTAEEPDRDVAVDADSSSTHTLSRRHRRRHRVDENKTLAADQQEEPLSTSTHRHRRHRSTNDTQAPQVFDAGRDTSFADVEQGTTTTSIRRHRRHRSQSSAVEAGDNAASAQGQGLETAIDTQSVGTATSRRRRRHRDHHNESAEGEAENVSKVAEQASSEPPLEADAIPQGEISSHRHRRHRHTSDTAESAPTANAAEPNDQSIPPNVNVAPVTSVNEEEEARVVSADVEAPAPPHDNDETTIATSHHRRRHRSHRSSVDASDAQLQEKDAAEPSLSEDFTSHRRRRHRHRSSDNVVSPQAEVSSSHENNVLTIDTSNASATSRRRRHRHHRHQSDEAEPVAHATEDLKRDTAADTVTSRGHRRRHRHPGESVSGAADVAPENSGAVGNTDEADPGNTDAGHHSTPQNGSQRAIFDGEDAVEETTIAATPDDGETEATSHRRRRHRRRSQSTVDPDVTPAPDANSGANAEDVTEADAASTHRRRKHRSRSERGADDPLAPPLSAATTSAVVDAADSAAAGDGSATTTTARRHRHRKHRDTTDDTAGDETSTRNAATTAEESVHRHRRHHSHQPSESIANDCQKAGGEGEKTQHPDTAALENDTQDTTRRKRRSRSSKGESPLDAPTEHSSGRPHHRHRSRNESVPAADVAAPPHREQSPLQPVSLSHNLAEAADETVTAALTEQEKTDNEQDNRGSNHHRRRHHHHSRREVERPEGAAAPEATRLDDTVQSDSLLRSFQSGYDTMDTLDRAQQRRLLASNPESFFDEPSQVVVPQGVVGVRSSRGAYAIPALQHTGGLPGAVDDGVDDDLYHSRYSAVTHEEDSDGADAILLRTSVNVNRENTQEVKPTPRVAVPKLPLNVAEKSKSDEVAAPGATGACAPKMKLRRGAERAQAAAAARKKTTLAADASPEPRDPRINRTDGDHARSGYSPARKAKRTRRVTARAAFSHPTTASILGLTANRTNPLPIVTPVKWTEFPGYNTKVPRNSTKNLPKREEKQQHEEPHQQPDDSIVHTAAVEVARATSHPREAKSVEAEPQTRSHLVETSERRAQQPHSEGKKQTPPPVGNELSEAVAHVLIPEVPSANNDDDEKPSSTAVEAWPAPPTPLDGRLKSVTFMTPKHSPDLSTASPQGSPKSAAADSVAGTPSQQLMPVPQTTSAVPPAGNEGGQDDSYSSSSRSSYSSSFSSPTSSVSSSNARNKEETSLTVVVASVPPPAVSPVASLQRRSPKPLSLRAKERQATAYDQIASKGRERREAIERRQEEKVLQERLQETFRPQISRGPSGHERSGVVASTAEWEKRRAKIAQQRARDAFDKQQGHHHDPVVDPHSAAIVQRMIRSDPEKRNVVDRLYPPTAGSSTTPQESKRGRSGADGVSPIFDDLYKRGRESRRQRREASEALREAETSAHMLGRSPPPPPKSDKEIRDHMANMAAHTETSARRRHRAHASSEISQESQKNKSPAETAAASHRDKLAARARERTMSKGATSAAARNSSASPNADTYVEDDEGAPAGTSVPFARSTSSAGGSSLLRQASSVREGSPIVPTSSRRQSRARDSQLASAYSDCMLRSFGETPVAGIVPSTKRVTREMYDGPARPLNRSFEEAAVASSQSRSRPRHDSITQKADELMGRWRELDAELRGLGAL